MLDHHLERGINPATVGPRRLLGVFVGQAGHTELAVGTDPTFDGPIGNSEFGGFRGVPGFQRELRIELRPRLAWLGQLTMTRPVPGQHFSDMLCACCHFSPLHVRQLGQYDSRDFLIIVGDRAGAFRNDPGIAGIQQLPQGHPPDTFVADALRSTSLPAGVVMTSVISTTSPS
jgi:hypothetical protein